MVIETQSLYDYLGRPAGSDLGQKIHAAAVAKDIFIGTKEINKNLVSQGKVCTYPITFLDEYFDRKPTTYLNLEERVRALEEKVKQLEGGEIVDNEDDLPF